MPTSKNLNMALSGKASASSEFGGPAMFPAWAANDGDRYAVGERKCWRGALREKTWFWQIDFTKPKTVAKLLQIMGLDSHVLMSAPKDYIWQWSNDGKSWRDIPGSKVAGETRLFRIITFSTPLRARYFRIKITSATGSAPAIREIEMFSDRRDNVKADPWFYVVNAAVERRDRLTVLESMDGFLSAARQSEGWENVQAQDIQATDFNENTLKPEPSPFCAFMTGSFLDWCQVERSNYTGVEEVLKNRNLPIWASCGSAQLLLILEQHGSRVPWVCPHCEWTRPDYYKTAPRPFVVGHVGCQGHPKCGELYGFCVGENNKQDIPYGQAEYSFTKVVPDPVFQGLPDPFRVVNRHWCEVKFLPQTWVLIATKCPGPEGLTKHQIMRVRNRYIYACQGHPEMAAYAGGRDGLPLIKNFLDLAYGWGGYNQDGKDVPDPSA